MDIEAMNYLRLRAARDRDAAFFFALRVKVMGPLWRAESKTPNGSRIM
jgi:hypothetical protein